MTTNDEDWQIPIQERIVVRLGEAALPFFAEYPYILWGEVNYDSDGDCERPTDRTWKWLSLRHRETDEEVEIEQVQTDHTLYEIEAVHPLTARLAAYLTAQRTGGCIVDPITAHEISLDKFAATVGLDDPESRLAMADIVQAMFLDPALVPFDSHWWWGGWKWVGLFASDFTIDARLAMLTVQRGSADAETIALLRAWWNEGPAEHHREGVRAALRAATGIDPANGE